VYDHKNSAEENKKKKKKKKKIDERGQRIINTVAWWDWEIRGERLVKI